MIKKNSVLKLLTLLTVLIVCLSSCDIYSLVTGKIGGRKSVSEYARIQLCAYHSFPLYMLADLKTPDWNAEIIEKDSYGRVLGELYIYDSLDDKIEEGSHKTYVFICQKTTREYVYFYEDINYLFPGYDNQDLEKLKEVNDWNKELNESKMSRREVSFTYDMAINVKKILTGTELRYLVCETFNVEEDDVLRVAAIDYDNISNEIFWCKILIDGQEKAYCVRVNSNKEVAYVEFTSGEFEYETYVAFKRSCGWNYGF